MSDDFDEGFASAASYARLYREHGLQVVPAKTPREDAKNYKRPALANWRQHQHKLVDDETFDSWFGERGAHVSRSNIGILTGAASGGVFIVDLDTHKHPEAKQWWDNLEYEHGLNTYICPPKQITGGGGIQMLFRAPAEWRPPTMKTPIGIDIRGEGGFAVMPPSMHESGRRYAWAEGLSPRDIEVMDAPKWLMDAIDELSKQYGAGGAHSTGPTEKTPSPQFERYGLTGDLIDGREEYMRRMIWAHLIDLKRNRPHISVPEMEQECIDTYQIYEQHVRSRLTDPAASKKDLLEREGRGLSAFIERWRSTLRKWDTAIAEEAKLPPRHPSAAAAFTADPEWVASKSLGAKTYPENGAGFLSKDGNPETSSKTEEVSGSDDDEVAEGFEASTPKQPEQRRRLELLDVDGIMALPDPKFLIEGLMVENCLGFVYGPPGSMKSFITLSVALSLATGQSAWWGRRIYRHGPVVYVSTEGVSDMKFRLQAWSLKTGISLAGAPFFLVRDSLSFMQKTDVSDLGNAIQDTLRGRGAPPPAVIFVDTVSRVLPGADENLQQDMTQFIAACDELRGAFGCAVVGVHHSARSGTNMRGSTVFDGAADFLLRVERDPEASIGVVTAEKIKAAADKWQEGFEAELVELEPTDGFHPAKTSLFVKKIAISASGSAAGDGFGGRQETNIVRFAGGQIAVETQEAMLAAVQAAFEEGRPWDNSSAAKLSGRHVGVMLSIRFPIVDAKKAERLVEGWLHSGKLERVLSAAGDYSLRRINITN